MSKMTSGKTDRQWAPRGENGSRFDGNRDGCNDPVDRCLGVGGTQSGGAL